MSSNTLFDLLNEIFRKDSAKDAVIFQGEVISYGELDQQSDCLAKQIIDKGVKPGSIIALGLQNGIGLIPSILAIWKANCVYLPIDPNYPSGRIEAMLKIANPELLMTKKELQNKFAFFKGQFFCIDEEHKIPKY